MKPTKTLLIFESVPADLPLDAEQANVLPERFRAEMQHAMFLDALERLRPEQGVRVIGFRHPDAGDLRELGASGVHDVREQAGGCVGRRIQDAIDQATDEGARHLLVLFSHAPWFASRFVIRAFALLDAFEDALILGSTSDGVLSAIGMRYTHPVIAEYLSGACVLKTEDVLRVLPSSEMLVLPLPSWHSPLSFTDIRALVESESLLSDQQANSHLVRVIREHRNLFNLETQAI